jgi:hypothetical protein
MTENIQQSQNSSAIPQEDVFFSWETWEVSPIVRNARWYTVAAVVGLGLLLYGLFTANFLFSIIVILFAVLTMVRDMRSGNRIVAAVTKSGFVFGDELFLFQDIRDFSIVVRSPGVKNLYLSFKGRLRPLLSVQLEEADPNALRQALLPFVLENLERDEESLTDMLRRVYKL